MSRRAIRAGRAEIYVGLNDDGVKKGFRDMETRMSTAAKMFDSVGKRMVGAGLTAAGAIAPVVFAASSFQESFSKFSVVFGDNTKAVKAWSDNLAKQIGRSKLQIVDFMGSSQDLFIPLGFEEGVATDLSKTVTSLAVDLASFNDKADADTLRDLHAALTGSGEVMKKYGVIVSEAAVKQELLNQGIDKSSATNQQKVQARLNLIMAGTVAAQGDAIRTAGSYANMMKRLKGIVVDFSVTAGTPLLDVLATISGTIGQVVQSGEEYIQKNNELVINVAITSAIVTALGISLLAAGVGLNMFATASTIAGVAVTVLKTALVVTKAIVIASTIAWIAFQVTAWAAAGATVAISSAVRAYGARAVVANIATAAWTTTIGAFRLAFLLMTNAVAVGKVVMGTYLLVQGAVSAGTAIMSGRIIAAGIAMRTMAAGSFLLNSVLSGTSIATSVMGAAQGVATIASGFLSGSLYGQVAAAVASSGAAAIVSTAWGAAGAVVTAVYGIITSPVSLIVATVIAVGAAFAVVAGILAGVAVGGEEFGRAWTYAKAVLSQFLTIAKTVFGGIRDALAAGQYMLAAKILWAGLKQAFWLGVKETISIFRSLPGTIWRIIKSFSSRFISTLWKLFKSIPAMIKNALTGVSLGDSISAILGTGDWLEGLATDKMISARSELDGLTAAAKKFREEKAAKDKQKASDEAAELAKRGGYDPTIARGGSGSSESEEAKESAFDKRKKALQEEIRELEMGAEAAELYKLKQEGATAEELEAVRALNERKRALEESKKAEEAARDAMLERIDKKADELFEEGFSPADIYRDQIALIDKKVSAGELTGEEGSEAKRKAAGDRDTRLASRRDAADEIRDGLKTPLDKFNDEVKRIQGLVKSGDLTRAEGSAAIAKQREDFADKNLPDDSKKQELGLARFGSKEAFESINRTRGIGGDGASQAPSWVSPMTTGMQHQVAASQALPQQIGASMAAATQKVINTKRLEELGQLQLTEQKKIPALLRTIATNISTSTEGDEL